MNELNHTPGKGDKDRSPGWRDHYEEIDFHRDQPDGFAHRGNRMVKAYGGRIAKFNFPEPVNPLVQQGVCLAVGPGPCRFTCTLRFGHEGEHIAEGLDGNVHERWSNTTGVIPDRGEP